jgi:hypothetical protein
MWNSLIDANISVHPIQLDLVQRPDQGWTSCAPPVDLILRQFADATGGNRRIESNGLLDGLAESVDGSRAYHMLGFSISAG